MTMILLFLSTALARQTSCFSPLDRLEPASLRRVSRPDLDRLVAPSRWTCNQIKVQ